VSHDNFQPPEGDRDEECVREDQWQQQLTDAYAEGRKDEREELTPAMRDVVTERRRQVEEEDWSPSHDDEHGHGELAKAAACYALHTEPVGNVGDYLRFWPWGGDSWKPKDRRRNLVRAGALILAEIERLDRAAPAPTPIS